MLIIVVHAEGAYSLIMNGNINLINILRKPASAAAFIYGNKNNPSLFGSVYFYQTNLGTFVLVNVDGLPVDQNKCPSKFFGFHIHDGVQCSGTAEDEFLNAGNHLSPQQCPHPMHMGDMPVLIGAGGKAFSVFLTDSFTVNDIVGKTVIIHSEADDFRSQPGGDSGEKIACGKIVPFAR